MINLTGNVEIAGTSINYVKADYTAKIPASLNHDVTRSIQTKGINRRSTFVVANKLPTNMTAFKEELKSGGINFDGNAPPISL